MSSVVIGRHRLSLAVIGFQTHRYSYYRWYPVHYDYCRPMPWEDYIYSITSIRKVAYRRYGTGIEPFLSHTEGKILFILSKPFSHARAIFILQSRAQCCQPGEPKDVLNSMCCFLIPDLLKR